MNNRTQQPIFKSACSMAGSLVRLRLGFCVRGAKMRVMSTIVVTESSELLLGFILVGVSSNLPSQEMLHVEFASWGFLHSDSMQLLHYEAPERG